MPLPLRKLYNLAVMMTGTTGTGTVTLGSVVPGFLSFGQAGVLDQEKVTYVISEGGSTEIGWGVYSTATTTLTRNVINSSNSNNPIVLGGNARVAISPAADDILLTRRQRKTANYTASAGETLVADVSGGTWTLSLPASPVIGDSVEVAIRCDTNFTNKLTLSGNGANVYSSAMSAVASVDIYGNGMRLLIVYDGSAWETVVLEAGILQQATASNSATLDVSNFCPLFDHYRLTWDNIVPATNAVRLQLVMSNDNGSTFKSANYILSCLSQFSGGATLYEDWNPNYTHWPMMVNATQPNVATLSTTFSRGDVNIYLGNGSNNTRIDGRTHWSNLATSHWSQTFYMANNASVTPANVIRIKYDSGNISAGMVRLQGVY